MRALFITQLFLLCSLIAGQYTGYPSYSSGRRQQPQSNRYQYNPPNIYNPHKRPQESTVNARTGNNDHLLPLRGNEAGVAHTNNQAGRQKTILNDGNVIGENNVDRDTNCFCLVNAQTCNPRGQVPRDSSAPTKPSRVSTRIVNTNPLSVCPEDRRLCCFVEIGVPTDPDPTPSPIFDNSCGTRRSIKPVTREGARLAHADFGEYPWTAAILSGNNDFIATGALVSSEYVLTAAHKIFNKGNQLSVRLGDYDLGNEHDFPNFPQQTVRVRNTIIHPSFNGNNLFNDVALLKLQRPVFYQDHIRPVCLPERNQRFEGNRCWVAGFGEDVDGSFSHIIREVDVPIITGVDCEASIRQTEGYTRHFILNKESFICAGGEEGKDACRGDGGAPLICEETPGKFTIAGMVAWGVKTCGSAGVPGVYVNVASFSQFIQQYVPISF